LIYGGLAILNLALGQFNQELGQGLVPIPAALLWIIPIASVVIVRVCSLLPSLSDVSKQSPQQKSPAPPAVK